MATKKATPRPESGDPGKSLAAQQAQVFGADQDLVARRLVMRRDVWEKLVGLADQLSKERGIEVIPADVAVVAIEAGLQDLRAKAKGKKSGG